MSAPSESEGKAKMETTLEWTEVAKTKGLYEAFEFAAGKPEYERKLRKFTAWLAQRMIRMMADKARTGSIETAVRFANGEATHEELEEAWQKAASLARDFPRNKELAARAVCCLSPAWRGAQETMLAAFKLAAFNGGFEAACEVEDEALEEFIRIADND